MYSMTKCPSCANQITAVQVVNLPGTVGVQNRWDCVSLNCPHCHTSLGMALDPVALNANLLAQIRQK